MRNLFFKTLQIDNRNFNFRKGLNVIVGANATGKTTIFNCLRHALGLTVDLPWLFFDRLRLIVVIGDQEISFRRKSSSALIDVEFGGRFYSFRAKSEQLDAFLSDLFKPRFEIGATLTSIFPILDFCFLSEEARPNSRSLSVALRLICHANDKLLSTATADVRAVKAQIANEDEFLRKNDEYVELFLRHLGAQPEEVLREIDRSLMKAREDVLNHIMQKRELVRTSSEKIEELTQRNQHAFSHAYGLIEQSFYNLLDNLPYLTRATPKFNELVSRSRANLSYGETILLDLVMFLSVARASCFVELNFPNFYVNDGMASRSIDANNRNSIAELLKLQIKENELFQYIEFVPYLDSDRGDVIADLGVAGFGL